MVDLGEFVSDYAQMCEGEKFTNKEVAEAYLDQNLEQGKSFEEELPKTTEQVAYYTGRSK